MSRLLAILSLIALAGGCAQTGTHTAHSAVASWLYKLSFYDRCLLQVATGDLLRQPAAPDLATDARQRMEDAEAFCAELDARRRAL